MQINSVAADGTKRSSGSRLNIFPMNDFLETQIQIGFENLVSFLRFDITSISRMYHGRSVDCLLGYLSSGSICRDRQTTIALYSIYSVPHSFDLLLN